MPTGAGATTIKRGTLSVELAPEASQFIVDSTSSESTHAVKMIMYGNGVTAAPGDCYHSAFTLSFKLKYLP